MPVHAHWLLASVTNRGLDQADDDLTGIFEGYKLALGAVPRRTSRKLDTSPAREALRRLSSRPSAGARGSSDEEHCSSDCFTLNVEVILVFDQFEVSVRRMTNLWSQPSVAHCLSNPTNGTGTVPLRARQKIASFYVITIDNPGMAEQYGLTERAARLSA